MTYRTQKVAVVSGATGQTGSYLIDLLLERGYYVIGLKRRTSLISTDRIDHQMNNKNFKMVYYSSFDPTVTYRIIQEYQPDEVYNMACQSHVKVSFETPQETMDSIIHGCLYWLEAIRILNPRTKFYQASSSEMFGRNTEVPLNEKSVMLPASPYACAKLAAHHLVQNYRESYNLFAVSGILFNHEGPRRGETFVTRKVTKAAAKIKLNLQKQLVLGNLDAKRDWGFAGDYADVIWRMLQISNAQDYVVATGETHTVREWVEEVFKHAGMEIEWRGIGLEEKGYINDVETIVISEMYYRPQEVPVLLGDPNKAYRDLQWDPKVKFSDLAQMMYKADYGEVLEENGGWIEASFFD